MNFLDLLNKVARQARPAHNEYNDIDDVNVKFTDTDVDSLDNMMIVMFFAIIYDISDEVAKDFHPETPKVLEDFINAHKKRDPESIDAALEMIK